VTLDHTGELAASPRTNLDRVDGPLFPRVSVKIKEIGEENRVAPAADVFKKLRRSVLNFMMTSFNAGYFFALPAIKFSTSFLVSGRRFSIPP
jgi:hypothetical protein